jgi:hypothetical protein
VRVVVGLRAGSVSSAADSFVVRGLALVLVRLAMGPVTPRPTFAHHFVDGNDVDQLQELAGLLNLGFQALLHAGRDGEFLAASAMPLAVARPPT